jgi:tRNA dimethylallyltransferase
VERQLIVVVGPTASGKTEFSIQLAEKLRTEIISADSRQFYKFLDIGTAKPDEHDLKKVKHHLISSLYPDEEYNISKFRDDVSAISEKLWENNLIPVITGGSGLYIKALVDGISKTPEPDPDIREQLLTEKNEFGVHYIYNKLKEVDPDSADSMLPQNWKRVIRALEVFYITGKPIWQIHQEVNQDNNFIVYQIGLNWEREILYARINERVDRMVENGLIEETKSIIEKGYHKNLNSMNTVGYKESIEYLSGEITLDRCIELIKRNSRRYAKRQMTWFRKDQRIQWETLKSNEDLIIFAEKTAEQFGYR